MSARAFFGSPLDAAAAGIRGVLFDVDGTLYSQPVLRACMAGELALATGRSPLTMRRTLGTLAAFRRRREDLRSLGVPSESIDELQYTRTAEDLRCDAEVVRGIVADWILSRPLRYMRVAARPGLAASLSALARQGLRIGALSDYPTDAKLEALGVRRHFSVALCTTDRSINAFKPHPKGFLVACAHWGLAPHEVLYVGDRPEVDAAGASAAGIRCIIVGRSRRTAGPGNISVVRRFSDIPHRVDAG